MLHHFLSKLPSTAPYREPLIERIQPCGLCNSKSGYLISKIDYWDLAEADLVQCHNCYTAQLDPMLTDEVMDLGCTAFYRLQHSNDNPKSIGRGFLRAFRQGVAFATRLWLAGIHPKKILEVGAGDGFFSRGLRYVFPQAQVTCLDLVEEVLDHIHREHEFSTIKGSPENLDVQKYAEQFDLIIARDVIEHLADPLSIAARAESKAIYG